MIKPHQPSMLRHVWTTIRRKLAICQAFAAMEAKNFLAYNLWFWVQFFGQMLMITIFVFFWRAVYANRPVISGLNESETITYVLLAQILGAGIQWGLVLRFGFLIREGLIAPLLLRPVDFQLTSYIEGVTVLVCGLIQQTLSVGLLAWFIFGLRLPSDPLVWGAFAISLLLGNAVLFCFDWMFACLAFSTTETWGLHTVREGIALFFSGSLVPLFLLPGWLQGVASALPFSQALHVPVSLLSGITPVSEAPRIWLIQLIWLISLGLLSRLVFRLSLRKITVQGG